MLGVEAGGLWVHRLHSKSLPKKKKWSTFRSWGINSRVPFTSDPSPISYISSISSDLACSLLLYTHHDQRQIGEEKLYFSLQVTAHLWGKPGQELKAEMKRRHGYSMLPNWFPLLSLACSDSFPRDGTTHGGLGPPMSISHQENVPQTGPWDNLIEAITFPRWLWVEEAKDDKLISSLFSLLVLFYVHVMGAF